MAITRPGLLKSSFTGFLPKMIKKYGGDVGLSVLNGEFLELPASKAEQIAEDLKDIRRSAPSWSSNTVLVAVENSRSSRPQNKLMRNSFGRRGYLR